MSGYGVEGPGPGAKPFDFSTPLPVVVATYDLADGVAACRLCAFRVSYDKRRVGWSMPLLEHAWWHDVRTGGLKVEPKKKTVPREPRERTRKPSTPADLQSRGLFDQE